MRDLCRGKCTKNAAEFKCFRGAERVTDSQFHSSTTKKSKFTLFSSPQFHSFTAPDCFLPVVGGSSFRRSRDLSLPELHGLARSKIFPRVFTALGDGVSLRAWTGQSTQHCRFSKAGFRVGSSVASHGHMCWAQTEVGSTTFIWYPDNSPRFDDVATHGKSDGMSATRLV